MKWPFKREGSREFSPELHDREIALERIKSCRKNFRNWRKEVGLKNFGNNDYWSRSRRNEINFLFLSDLYNLYDLPQEISELKNIENLCIGRAQNSITNLFNDSIEVCEGAINISDISCLYGLKNLREVNLSGTKVVDLSPLRDAKNLEVLDIEGTPIKSLEPIKHLPRLRAIYMANSQVEDLAPLASLPAITSDLPTQFGIKGIPALVRDPALALIARLGADGNSEDLVSYLKGSHPAFLSGGLANSLNGRELLAASSPVSFELVDGQVEAINRPELTALRLTSDTGELDIVRQLAADLLAEAQFLQVPAKLHRRLKYYHDKAASDNPIFLVLEGTMAYLRGALADEFIVEATDPGFVRACKHLVQCHDVLREVYLPKVSDKFASQAAQDVDVDALTAVIKRSQNALTDPTVRPSVNEAIEAIRGYAEAAADKREPTEKTSLVVRGFVLLGGLLTKLAESATLQTWASSPAGKEVLARIKPLIEYVVKILGIGG